jgi:hypothetical protein
MNDRKAEPITRRRNHSYALRYGWRWVWDYVRWRRPAAALRTIYWTLIRGWDGEACQFCGRPYLLWRAPDDLWLDLIGSPHGLCCLTCFDDRARQRGVWLQWRPEAS